MIGFENQLKTEDERTAFFCLEVNSRSIKSVNDVNSVFNDTIYSKPILKTLDWVEPLRTAMLQFVSSNTDDNERNGIREFIKETKQKYIGSLFLSIKDDVKGLSVFSQEELDLPHMRWIIALDKKYRHYRSVFSNLRTTACVTMATYSTLSDLSDDKLLELYQSFRSIDCDYNCSMDFSDWVNWYVNSAAKFDVSGELLETEANQMKKTLIAWNGQSIDSLTYWITRNYEIHPFHEDKITEWIVETNPLLS